MGATATQDDCYDRKPSLFIEDTMLTTFLRVLLGHQISPYTFRSDRNSLPDLDVPNFGIYVHIPFCEKLCSFCPYYKELADKQKLPNYLAALNDEIGLASQRLSIQESKKEVTTLYFGGGSPATMIDDLPVIRSEIDKSFRITGNTGVELHPRDVDDKTLSKLCNAGVDMVSLGVQSFSQKLQRNLGREYFDCADSLKRLNINKFKSIDVDLIFGIPGQTEIDITEDFSRAVDLGATQISTYPFIDFSYANNSLKPQSHCYQKKLLNALLKTAAIKGFIRTSVWTFGKVNAPRYSSVTRDNFLGFGPSATTLGMDAFKVNTFSVDAYIESLKLGQIPTALTMTFSRRARRVYWLFWNCYNGYLSTEIYRNLFTSELVDDFSLFLSLGMFIGFLLKIPEGWILTERGSYYFHRIEQLYTHQYIDKTWHSSMKNPWPERINLY